VNTSEMIVVRSGWVTYVFDGIKLKISWSSKVGVCMLSNSRLRISAAVICEHTGTQAMTWRPQRVCIG
jgi:hypothetical protein